MIFSGELAAGSDHLESELAASLGMSRTPVREAALVLETQGLVTVRPRRGLRVTAIARADVAEIHDVLAELESHAAGQAASFGYDEDATAGLAGQLELMEAALARGDLDGWSEADDAFHRELVRLGRNRRVEAIAGLMADQLRRARRQTLFARPADGISCEDQRKVLDAVRAGAVYSAQSVQRAHRQRMRDEMLGIMKAHRLHQL